jgi:toxin ParE1/3/4
MLDEAVAYVAQDSRDAAVDLLLDALDAADSLATMAERGRLVPELAHPELRELLVQRYRLVYRVKADHVELIAFVHGARDFARLLGED